MDETETEVTPDQFGANLQPSIKKLLDAYNLDEKNNFFVAYMYLKHHFNMVYRLSEFAGLATTATPPAELEETLEVFMQAYLESVRMDVFSRETIPYASKVVTLEDAKQLVTIKEPIDLRNLSNVIPFAQANSIILENPDAIALGRCACRLARADYCEPMGEGLPDEGGVDCCFFIGEPWVSVITEDPRFRRCSQDEAVHVLEKCHEFGVPQLAFWRKELNRNFYSICNCCKCCCIGMLAHNAFGGAVPCVVPSGYKVALNADACSGCGICEEHCNFLAMTVDEEAGKAVVDIGKCMGCGVCADLCPEGALKLTRDETELEPIDVAALRRKYGS